MTVSIRWAPGALAHAQLWHRYRQGQSCGTIARALGRDRLGARRVIRARGGFSLPQRRRHPRSLSLAERQEISRGISAQLLIRKIAC